MSSDLALNASTLVASIRLNSLLISTNCAAANSFQSDDFKSALIFDTNEETASLDLSNDAVGINCNVCRTGLLSESNKSKERNF